MIMSNFSYAHQPPLFSLRKFYLVFIPEVVMNLFCCCWQFYVHFTYLSYQPLSDIWCLKVCLHPVGCIYFSDHFFCNEKLFSLMQFHLFIFAFFPLLMKLNPRDTSENTSEVKLIEINLSSPWHIWWILV